ncbi:hypothetical protein [Oricola sp.]|uniref:hypothetical protein n=1 Tax=Oricola sp. TaxID=1979950 RepID=UPI0025F7DBD5|nr:hypothetical protein [Oricola sp.]MCI5075343.1 hypothetical protein [Oricola sp.]
MKPLGSLLLLVACVCGVGLLSNRLLHYPVDISPITADAASVDQPPASAGTLLASPMRPATAFSQIVTRPLFSRTRRKFTPPPVSAQPPQSAVAKRASPTPRKAEMRPPELKLLGVSMGAQQARVLLSSKDAPPAWIASGMKIDDWTVETIDADGAVMTNDGRRFRLDLYRSAGEL